jgi:hypothetical protein
MATTYHDAAVSEVRYGNWQRQEFYLLQDFLEALQKMVKDSSPRSPRFGDDVKHYWSARYTLISVKALQNPILPKAPQL